MNAQFDLGAVTPARYFFGIAVVLGLVLGFASGDDDAALGPKLLLWQTQAVGIMACMVLTQVQLLRWRWFEQRNPWLQLTASGLIGSLLFAPAGTILDTWLGQESLTESGLWVSVLDEFSGVAPPAIVLWLAVNTPWMLGFKLERVEPGSDRETQTDASEAVLNSGDSAASSSPQFFDLLPKEVRGPVQYLQAELHYISVVTDRGRALVLYNLRDAIEEMQAHGVTGFQCHRSYWVAATSPVEFRRVGRQGELRLANGDTVPVSRRNLEQVAARLGA